MFATVYAMIELPPERVGDACWNRLGELAARAARDTHEVGELVRGAADRGDWKQAGFASIAQWFAQAYGCDHSTAVRITRTALALRELPELDGAMSRGLLTLDQAVAASSVATPETDAELARTAVGKAPSEIERIAHVLVPPKVADDQTLYERRALSMTWTRGRRELRFSGCLPLEQAAAFEQAIWNIAKPMRALDKKTGSPVLEWRQYTADALLTLATQPGDAAGGPRRSPTTLIVHLSEDGTPPLLEGAGPISPETAERLCCDSRKIAIKLVGSDLVHSRTGRCASYPQLRALYKRSGGRCQYPGCTATRELEAHHILAYERGGPTEIDNLILLCLRHHKLLHDNHIRTSGHSENPIFTDENGRAITANQPHAPPR